MKGDNTLLWVFIAFMIFVILIWKKGQESFKCRNYNPGDISHCPRSCSPFLYPDMYQPLPVCSDPFKWGYTYSTGRCPHTFTTF